MNDFRAAIATMQREEDRLFEVRHADVRRSFVRTLVVLVGASTVLGLALLYLVQTGRDLDRARADAEVAVDRARAVEFNDRFLGILGHDLKNPLTAIRISVERLEKKLGEEGQPHLARIHRSLDRMGRMIDQLLDLSRIRLGSGITLARRPIDAAEIVRDAVEELRAAHPRRSVELVVSGDTTGSFDPDRLSQIATNLIGNAVVHGAAAAIVKASLEGRAHELVLRVENAGTMTSADRFVLFDPFRRGLHEPSKTTRSAGLGLGLAIVRHLVEQHHGRIVIESGPATVFTVFLPR
jgi:signal transduction histidine kinase